MDKALRNIGLAILVLAATTAQAFPFFHKSAPAEPTPEQLKEMQKLSSCGLAHVHDRFFDRPGGYLSARASRRGQEGYYLLNESGAIFVPLSKSDFATDAIAVKQKITFPGAKEAAYLAVLGLGDPDAFGPYVEPSSAKVEESEYAAADTIAVPPGEALDAIRERAKTNLLKELTNEVSSLREMQEHPEDFASDKTLWLDAVARAVKADPKRWWHQVAEAVKSTIDFPRTEGGVVQAKLSGCTLDLSPEIVSEASEVRILAATLTRAPEYDAGPLEQALERSRVSVASLQPLNEKTPGFQRIAGIIGKHLKSEQRPPAGSPSH